MAKKDEIDVNSMPNAATVEGGQIALTAFNRGDGLWDVTAGPGGRVVVEGVPREKALSIVGAPTGPYVPATNQEITAAAEREDAEKVIIDEAATDALLSDKDLGLVDDRGRPTIAAGSDPVDERRDARQPPSAGARKGAANSPGGAENNGG